MTSNPSFSLVQMTCAVKDALLSANFDESALLNRLSDCGASACVERFGYGRDAHSITHMLIHRSPQVARYFERFLDRMHSRKRAEVSATESQLIMTWCRQANWRALSDLGGVLWALARDPRAEVQRDF